ncbi:serine--tRNA ligase [[Clostridium] methylpentosum DSM 5476]|uniref:Serine--tRNA ligase n=1 Tax=[Clostridium] methylpentosum DSM 5476 TaxID=537013 RepID=C0EA30_9FIRM|nr:serine--tRNA ligase [[Clostridium] methylpentosum DSM 5476]MDY3987987.1 serine--tRNA ligase [Massilioclostridium sp.]MEE1492509.1 serine--tRNA ligase [Massilioclostridium sp.]
MLDIKLIRTDAEMVKKAMRDRNKNMDETIDEILEIDRERREISTQKDAMKAEQNKVSKQIPILKKENGNVEEVMENMKKLSDEIKELNAKTSELEAKQKDLLLRIPNIPHPSVPIGKSEDDNQEIRKFGTPTTFDFEPKAHWDLGKDLGILDPDTAAKVTGARFHFYKGAGARLERAVINFYLDTHTKNGYTEVFPPFMVNRASMTGTGQLPKFEEDAFRLANMDYFLIPTAEVPVTNMYRDEIIDGDKIPVKFCAYSACFRAEAGSAGRDTRGLIRQHQFNKVELVKFADPENSYEELEKLTADAERVLQLLELPYRVVCLSTGDLGFSSAKTYDIEVWLPSYNNYKEISSCSNFEDFQARRANIKFKKSAKEKAQLVHTLNGSGVAIGRTVAAILENYQNEDGSVTVPKVLVPYMGCEVIQAE